MTLSCLEPADVFEPGLSRRFVLRAGSVVGREHVRRLRNNQDAVAVRQEPTLWVAALADGCSSAPHSEVGARLAVRWLVQQLPRFLAVAANEDELSELLGDALLAYLESFITPLSTNGYGRVEAVADFLLFTVLILIVDRDRTRVLSCGDGIFWVQGEPPIVLDSGPGNAPPYLAYRLAGPAAIQGASRPKLITVLSQPTQSLDGLLIGSDGAEDLLGSGDLEELFAASRLLRNPLSLQRELVVLGQNRRLLADDTTLVLLRRREV